MMSRRLSSLGIILVLTGCGTAFNFEYGQRGLSPFMKPRPRDNVMDFLGNLFQQHLQNGEPWPKLIQPENQMQAISHWGLYQRPTQQPDYERHFYNFGEQHNDVCSDEVTDYSSLDGGSQESSNPDNFYPRGEEDSEYRDHPVACSDDDKGIRWKGAQPEQAYVEIEEVVSRGGQSQWDPNGGGYEDDEAPQITPNINGLSNVEIHNCFPQNAQGRNEGAIRPSPIAGNEYFVLVIKKDHFVGDARKLNTTATSIDAIIGATLDAINPTSSVDDVNATVNSSTSMSDSQPRTQTPTKSRPSTGMSDEAAPQSPKTPENPGTIILSTTPAVDSQSKSIPTEFSFSQPRTQTPTKSPPSTEMSDATAPQSSKTLENPGTIISNTTPAADSQSKSIPTESPLRSAMGPVTAPKRVPDEAGVQPMDGPTKISLATEDKIFRKNPIIPIVNTPVPTVMPTFTTSTTSFVNPTKDSQASVPPSNSLTSPETLGVRPTTDEEEDSQSQNPSSGMNTQASLTPPQRTLQSPNLPSGTTFRLRKPEVIVNYATSTETPIFAVGSGSSNSQASEFPTSSSEDKTPKVGDSSSQTVPSIVNYASHRSLPPAKTKSDSNTIVNDNSSGVQRPQLTISKDSTLVLDSAKPDEEVLTKVPTVTTTIVNKNEPVIGNPKTPIYLDSSAFSDSRLAFDQSKPTMTNVNVDPGSTTVNPITPTSLTNLSDPKQALKPAPAISQPRDPIIVNVPPVEANLNSSQVNSSQENATIGSGAKIYPPVMRDPIVNKTPTTNVKPQANAVDSKRINDPSQEVNRATDEDVLSDSAELQAGTTVNESQVVKNPKSTFPSSSVSNYPSQAADRSKDDTTTDSSSDVDAELQTTIIVNEAFPFTARPQTNNIVSSRQNDPYLTAVKTTPTEDGAMSTTTTVSIVNDLSSVAGKPTSLTTHSRKLISSVPTGDKSQPTEIHINKSVGISTDPPSKTPTIVNDMILRSQPTSSSSNTGSDSVQMVGAAKSSEGQAPATTKRTDSQSKARTIVNGGMPDTSNENLVSSSPSIRFLSDPKPRKGQTRHNGSESITRVNSDPRSQTNVSATVNGMESARSFNSSRVNDSKLSSGKDVTPMLRAVPDSTSSNDSQLTGLESASLIKLEENRSKTVTESPKAPSVDFILEGYSQSAIVNSNPTLIVNGTKYSDRDIAGPTVAAVAVSPSEDLISDSNSVSNSEFNPVSSSVPLMSNSQFGGADSGVTASTKSQIGAIAGHNIHDLGHAIKGLHELVNKLMSTVNSTSSNIGLKTNSELIPQNVLNKPQSVGEIPENERNVTVNGSQSTGNLVIRPNADEIQRDFNATPIVSAKNPQLNEEVLRTEAVKVADSQYRKLNSSPNAMKENGKSSVSNLGASTSDTSSSSGNVTDSQYTKFNSHSNAVEGSGKSSLNNLAASSNDTLSSTADVAGSQYTKFNLFSRTMKGNGKSSVNSSVAPTVDLTSTAVVYSQWPKSTSNASTSKTGDAIEGRTFTPSTIEDINLKTKDVLSNTNLTVNENIHISYEPPKRNENKSNSSSGSENNETVTLESSISNSNSNVIVTDPGNGANSSRGPGSSLSLDSIQNSISNSSASQSSETTNSGNVKLSSQSTDSAISSDPANARTVSDDNSSTDNYDASSFTSTFDPVPSSTEETKKSPSKSSNYHKILRLMTWLRGKKDADEDHLHEPAFDPIDDIVESSDNGVPVIDKDILPENLANWFLGFHSVEDDDGLFASTGNESESSELPASSSEFSDLYHSFLEAAIHNVNNVSSIVNASEPIGTPLSWWSSYREADAVQNDGEVGSNEKAAVEGAIHQGNNASSTVNESPSTWSRWWSKLKGYKNVLRRAPTLNESMADRNFEASYQTGDGSERSFVGEIHEVADGDLQSSNRLSRFWETKNAQQRNDTPSDETLWNLTSKAENTSALTYVWSSSNGTSFGSNITDGDVVGSNVGEFYQFATGNANKSLEDGGKVEITFSQPTSGWLSLLAQLQEARKASAAAVNGTDLESSVTVTSAKPKSYSHFHASDFEVWSDENE